MTTSASNRPASTPMQATTVGLHVASISTLATVFEFLFAYSLPPPFRAQEDVLEKFDLVDVDAEVMEANKWQMMTILQSFDAVLGEECMSCPQRMSVKRQVARLAAASGANHHPNHSNNLFSDAANAEPSTSRIFSPTQPMPPSSATLSRPRHWPDQQQMPFYGNNDSQPPMSPYYYSLTFPDVDVSALSQQAGPSYPSRDNARGPSSAPYRGDAAAARTPAQQKFPMNEDIFDRTWASSPAMSAFPVPQSPSPIKRERGNNNINNNNSSSSGLTKDQVMMPPPPESILSNSSHHVMLYTPAEFRSMNLDPDVGPSYSFSPTRPSAGNEGQGQYQMSSW